MSGLEADATTYTLSIVDEKGQIAASATASNPDHAPVPWQPLPLVSTSASRAYYLDGANTVKFLKPDGNRGILTELPNQTGERVVFAVSSDDSQIAASVFNLTSGMRLYTAALGPSLAWHEIFATTAYSEWPVGWHGHELVLGLGYVKGGQETCVECSWTPNGFHLANPDTGARLATVCDSSSANQVAASAPTIAGVLCTTNTSPSATGSWTSTTTAIAHWDGSKGPDIPTDPALSSCPLRGALSPDGALIATIRGLADCSNGTTINLFDISGRGRATLGRGGYRQMFWVDADNLCYSTEDDKSSILNASSGQIAAVVAPGLCMAAIPGGLD